MGSMKLSVVPFLNFSICLPIVGFLFLLTLLLECGWELFKLLIRLWIRGNVHFIHFFYFDPRRRLSLQWDLVNAFYHRTVLYWFNLSCQNSSVFIVRFLATFFETRKKAS